LVRLLVQFFSKQTGVRRGKLLRARLALKDFFEKGLPSINQCAKAHRRIQNIQLRLLKSFGNKQQSQNMEKLPYIVSLSLYFAIC
jgi:hypothetical protein